MSVLTYDQVYALARGAGLNPAAAVIATAVAKGESGFNTDAVGDVGLADKPGGRWGPSVGLWQVRTLQAQTGTGQARDINRLKDPKFNAAAMAEISGMGKNFKPWSVYLHGTYKSYLGQSLTVAKTVDGNPGVLDKLLAGLINLPVVGGAVDSAAKAGAGATTTVTDAISNINPLATWQADAQGIAIKSLVLAAGAGLFVAGAIRLVVPAAISETRAATGL